MAALDARTIKFDQRTLSALYHANLRAELTDRLAVRWEEPENGIAEIADVPDQVLAEFSQRTNDIDDRVTAKLDRFRHDLDREPTPEERWRLEREAVTDSRPAKRHGITHDDLQAEWWDRTRQLGFEPDDLVRAAIGRQRTRSVVDHRVAARMVSEAVEALEDKQSSWRPAEALRELAATLPTTVPAAADRLTPWLQAVTDHMVEARCVDLTPPPPSGTPLRRDGRPITEPSVDHKLTTQTILDQEQQILGWAAQRIEEPLWTPRMVRTDGLDPGQVEVATAVAGNRGLELVVGPAGAGKTTALYAGVRNLSRQGRLAFGVAPTEPSQAPAREQPATHRPPPVRQTVGAKPRRAQDRRPTHPRSNAIASCLDYPEELSVWFRRISGRLSVVSMVSMS